MVGILADLIAHTQHVCVRLWCGGIDYEW